MVSAAFTEINLELTEFTFWETRAFSVFIKAVFTDSDRKSVV